MRPYPPKIKSLLPRRNWPGRGKIISSAIQVNETSCEYVIHLAVPGMQRKDFSISMDKKTMKVSAEKRDVFLGCMPPDQQSPAHWSETFKLPPDADTVMTAAVYRNGELEIHIPRGGGKTTNLPAEIIVY